MSTPSTSSFWLTGGGQSPADTEVASPPGSTSSSSSSAASTVRADDEDDSASNATTLHDSDLLHHRRQFRACSSQSPDLRARSISAPSSRSSSFANLNQLVALNQSAHRFPVTLPSASPSTHQEALYETAYYGTAASVHADRRDNSRSPASTHSQPQSIAATSRSTPTSPYLSPTLPQADSFGRSAPPATSELHDAIARVRSEGSRGNTAGARARAILFSTGSGFTPAFERPPSHQGADSAGSRTRQNSVPTAGGRLSSSSAASLETTSSPTGRMRSTSASEGAADAAHRSRRRSNSSATNIPSTHAPQRAPRRRRAQSARSSPTLTSSRFLPLESASTPLSPTLPSSSSHSTRAPPLPPQRTHSVPHLARISPIFLSYGYPCEYAPAGDGNNTGGGAFGYFALPPAMQAASSSAAQEQSDDLPPPPYSPSERDIPALSLLSAAMSSHQVTSSNGNVTTPAATLRNDSSADDDDDDDDDGNGGALSFTTNRIRSSLDHPTRTTDARVADDQSGTTALGTTMTTPGLQRDVRSNANGSSAPPEDSLASPVSRSRLLEGEPVAEEEWDYIERLERPSKLRQFVLMYLVHPLRLLAVVPGVIGTFWLLRNAVVVAWANGGVVWQRKDPTHAAQPSALEFLLASLWSFTTAYHALSFTTLLLRRWLHYYSLLPSLIRIIALQALCWPLVRLTLFVLGPRNPLPAWAIISSTTACSDTVARWVVSNITDESDGLSNTAMGIGGGSTSVIELQNKYRYGRNHLRYPTSTTPLRATRSCNHTSSGIGMAFWRAVMGAPPRQRSGRLSATLTTAERRGFATESEAESDAESMMHRRRAGTQPLLARTSSSSLSAPALRTGLHRRLQYANAGAATDDNMSEVTSGGEGEDSLSELPSDAAHRTHVRHIERVGRIFHWDVAIRRNILPIGVLAYMTMWVLLVEDVRLRL